MTRKCETHPFGDFGNYQGLSGCHWCDHKERCIKMTRIYQRRERIKGVAKDCIINFTFNDADNPIHHRNLYCKTNCGMRCFKGKDYKRKLLLRKNKKVLDKDIIK